MDLYTVSLQSVPSLQRSPSRWAEVFEAILAAAPGRVTVVPCQDELEAMKSRISIMATSYKKNISITTAVRGNLIYIQRKTPHVKLEINL